MKCNKHKYKTQKQAANDAKILRRLSHEAVTWYHCKYCDAFHVGHRADKKR